VVFTHALPHCVVPPAQERPHWPREHTSPAAVSQALLQAPQFAGSLCVLTQTPSQSVALQELPPAPPPTPPPPLLVVEVLPPLPLATPPPQPDQAASNTRSDDAPAIWRLPHACA